MNITVIGAGYVGLVTATCFADLGNKVLCIEKSENKIRKLSAGESPIYEPGLTELLRENIERKNLLFGRDIAEGVAYADVIFLCVGTPQSEDGRADLSQVEEASRQIALCMKSYKLVIEKSTVPVNTHRWVKRTMYRYLSSDIPFDVASNPEFLREGSALSDFMNPDRIVVGVENDRVKETFIALYKPITDKGHPLLVTNPAEAELIKHAANSFLAMKISYINKLADLCEKTGADITMVAKGIGLDTRIGTRFLQAGIGYGGSCFPKDVKAFIRIAEQNGVDFTLLKDTEIINCERRERFIDKIEQILWINKDKNIAVWGLAFKADTDDIRESPAITIVKALEESGANLFLYDPAAMDNFKLVMPEKANLRYAQDKYDALSNCDALIVLTDWKEFAEADLSEVKKRLRLPIVIDGRNIFPLELMKTQGFEYYSIGR